MPRNCFFVLLLAPFFLFSLPAIGADPADGDLADTRILIDISGSMKKNDPSNLRRPALRMLVGLLPTDSRAGVWTFGQYVNMQVALGKVDNAWKERARKGAGQIHSRGLFTNIEEVIRRSIADWKDASKTYRRNLILLTDGMVDVSKDQAKSAASRQRVLDELIPRLQEYGAKVHTMALSERADHELMKTLSDATGGWYEQVDKAEQLQRVFLRLFEKVGRPDTVPLNENRFTIDKSITEATLLVFRKEGAAPTRITTPSGESYSAKDSPATIKWHRDEGYDMLTISAPEVGEWRIEAALDPDNRVMIVTDLKMHTTELPNKLAVGEQLPFEVSFSEKGEGITDPAFLEVLNVQAEQSDAGGPGEPRPLYDDGENGDAAAADGRYTLVVGEQAEPGRIELLLRVEGKTFQREQRQVYELIPCCRVEAVTGDGESTKVAVHTDPELLDSTSVTIEAGLRGSEADSRPVMLLPGAAAGIWETTIDRSTLAGEWVLEMNLSARTIAGNALALTLDPVALSGTAKPPPPLVVEPPVVEQSPEPEQQTDWMMLSGIFAGANLVLLIVVGALVWLIRRRGKGNTVQLLDDDEPGTEGAGA